MIHTRWNTDSRALLIILGAVSVEAVVVGCFWDIHSSQVWGGDGPAYHTLAMNLLAHFRYSLDIHPPFEPTVQRTPGYPIFLALVYLLFGPSFVILRLVQIAILGLTGWFLRGLATRFVSQRAALLSGVLCATYPPFLFLTYTHLTEILAIFLTVLFVLLLVQVGEHPKPSIRSVCSLGAVSAVATLVRPSMALLVTVPMVFIFVHTFGKQRIRRALLLTILVGAFSATMAPWVVRNYLACGRFVPLGAVTGGWSLFLSAEQYTGEITYRMTVSEFTQIIAEFMERWKRASVAGGEIGDAGYGLNPMPAEIAKELYVDRSYKVDALQRFRSLRPLQVLASLPTRVAYLWSTGDMSPWSTSPLHRFMQGHYAVLVLLTLVGIWINRASGLSQWPLWIMPIYVIIVHIVFQSEPRYSFPARPFMSVYAGAGLAHIVTFLQRKEQDEYPHAKDSKEQIVLGR